MIKHFFPLLALPLLALILGFGICPVHADGLEETLPASKRIRIVMYDPTDLYTVPTKYGYQTSIVFGRNETIATVSVGDRSMWQIIPAGNRLFIRPMENELSTNMTVITNLHEYAFEIKSLSEDQGNNVYVLRFRYPEKEKAKAAEPPIPAPIDVVPQSLSNVTIPPLDTQRTQERNTRYTYIGPDEMAPAQVVDDGKQTYVTYKQMPSPPPQPVLQTSAGQHVVVKHKIEGNQIIINNVVSNFILRSPAGNITVYNESFYP